MGKTFRAGRYSIPAETVLIAAIAAVKLIIHLVLNYGGGYGIFRDELYYLACADHIDTGYVDQPPFSIYLLAVNRFLFGDSIFALRLIPAILGALTVFFAGLTARAMGGTLRAQLFAALGVFAMPILFGMNSIYSMNSIDIFLWTLGGYFVVRLITTGQPRYWLILGCIVGIGLLNKISMGWFGAGLALAVILTKERAWLKTPWPFIAGAIAFLLFLPYIVWNIQHDMAHLTFIRNASGGKYSSQNAGTFLAGQLLLPNPALLPFWLSGLASFFFWKPGRKFMMLGIVFVVTAAILLINGHSKAEYLAVAYPMVFAGGGVFYASIIRGRWIDFTYGGLVLLVTVTVLPFAVPVLPVESFITYEGVTGIKPSTAEAKELSELPQFYADMFGWEDKAKAVAKAYYSLSPEERARCVLYGDNYGRSGAIDYYGRKMGLPPAVGRHNSYWFWGPGKYDGGVVIVLGGGYEDKKRIFDSVEVADTVTSKYVMPYENNLRVYICRGLKMPVQELWQRNRVFD